MKSKINTSALKWLYKAQGRKNLYVLYLILANTVLGSSGVAYALLYRSVIDSAASHNGPAFKHYAILIIILIAADLLLRALLRWLNELSKSTFENNLKKRLAENILKKDYASISALHSGEWLNRLASDTSVVADGYVDILPGLSGLVVRLVSALIMIVALDRWFAYILVPGGILVIIVTYAFRKVLKKLHKTVREKDGNLRVFLQERISSLMIIKSFAAEPQTETELDEMLDDYKKARMKRNYFSNFCNLGFGTAMNAMYLIGVFYCGYGMLKGTISYGTLAAITQLIGQVQSPFANISGYLPRYYSVIASAERLMEVENFEDDLEGESMTCSEVNEYYHRSLAAFGLNGAGFTYYPATEGIDGLTKEGMPVVLKNLSLEIKKGDYVAFTGHSGCGKSTVLKLLMCVYQLDEGTRYLVEANGSKTKLTAEKRRLFAYVPQGNQLISGSIREVVTFAAPEYADDDERINRALKIACADEFIAELENGIDTLLGERGAGLSEGQTQRLALARAIFSESPILLLDEATSALDELTEKRLLENLRNLTDKTVIIVTHRPAALSICDHIMNFTENGVEQK